MELRFYFLKLIYIVLSCMLSHTEKRDRSFKKYILDNYPPYQCLSEHRPKKQDKEGLSAESFHAPVSKSQAFFPSHLQWLLREIWLFR